MSDRPTLLLVHGAWHGAWAWEPLQSELEARGWDVRTVDLPTVHADDPRGLHMTDDADAIAAAIDEIGGPVAVVAHSYGGVPTTQGATSESVVHIVYIAAFVLDAGESLLGSVGGVAPSWWVVDGPLATAGTEAEPAAGLFFGDVDDAVAATAVGQLKAQSSAAFSDEVTAVAWRDKDTTYVITEQDVIFPLPAQEALAARSGSTAVRMDTSHSPFLSKPSELADIIENALG